MPFFDGALPSKLKQDTATAKYPQFIEAFEEIVTDCQLHIEGVRRLESLYDCILKILKTAAFKPNAAIVIHPYCIDIKVLPQPSDTYLKFDQLANELGQALKEANYTSNVDYSHYAGGVEPGLFYSWYLYSGVSVRLIICVGSEGLQDCYFESEMKPSQAYVWTLKMKES